MVEKGLSQTALAKLVGISQATIWKLLNEPAQGSKHIHKIAQAVGTTPAYLMGETDDPTEGYVAPPSVYDVAANLDLVPVRELDLALGMGATFLDNPVTERIQHFPRSWLRNFTNSPPDDLFFAHAVGDSMMPTMVSGDIVLIDRGEKIVDSADLIWAFAYEGMGMIKRLGPGRGGNVELISDNPSVRSRFALPDELHIIGRIVAIVRKM